MWALLGRLVAFLAGLLARSRAKPPAERAAVAETRLETERANHEALSSAVDARRAVDDRILREPDSVRAPDKYSRD